MTTPINKTTQFNQQLTFTAAGGGTDNYASFNGSINQYGVPAVNYYISNNDAYRGNLSDFRESWSKFQDVVFAEADKVTASIKPEEQVTADGH